MLIRGKGGADSGATFGEVWGLLCLGNGAVNMKVVREGWLM